MIEGVIQDNNDQFSPNKYLFVNNPIKSTEKYLMMNNINNKENNRFDSPNDFTP